MIQPAFKFSLAYMQMLDICKMEIVFSRYSQNAYQRIFADDPCMEHVW